MTDCNGERIVFTYSKVVWLGLSKSMMLVEAPFAIIDGREGRVPPSFNCIVIWVASRAERLVEL